MASSNFQIPTTLTTSGTLVNPSSAVDKAALMYKTASGAFVATELAVPVGTIRMFTSASTPTNYIVCNGQSLNTYTYRALHAVMSNKYGGTAYSAGVTDQSGAATTFSLPNLVNTVLPYASNANSSLTTSINIGSSGANLDHSHSFPITYSAGSGSTAHNHGANAGVSGNHTHTFASNTQIGGSHSHNIQGTNATHSHVFVRSNVAGNDITSNASANHSHSLTGPSAGHTHSLNAGDGHTHSTSNDGGNHSSHNYQMTSNAATLSHTHTSTSITGLWFYVRYQ